MENDNLAKHLSSVPHFVHIYILLTVSNTSGDILTELYINKTFMLVNPLPCQIQTPEWLCHFFAHFLTLCGGVYIQIIFFTLFL